MQAGHILIMDNALYHYGQPFLRELVNHGILPFFLPTYSPDFNPTETVCAMLCLVGFRFGRPRFFSVLILTALSCLVYCVISFARAFEMCRSTLQVIANVKNWHQHNAEHFRALDFCDECILHQAMLHASDSVDATILNNVYDA